jgi:mRNA interferase MazF
VTGFRSEVWLVDFGDPVGREQAARRPAVIVSTDYLNQGPAGLAIVVPVTTAHRDLPTHIEVETGVSGLDETSYAKCEDVRSVSEHRLMGRLGRVGPDVMHEISRALTYLLDL